MPKQAWGPTDKERIRSAEKGRRRTEYLSLKSESSAIEAEVVLSEAEGCPLCHFIEAGPCKVPHEEWVSCRKNAKEQKKDYVTECSETFRTFLQCTLEHDDYYQPFLEMLGLDKDYSSKGASWGTHA
ncbi:hypothetical protein DUNSADRAFT_16666 [Dunaliella salina]|uniref:GCK domain-containing protein n=1 Tax=Dunaliella salina TaxID=3046 RepID=A0ABQ7H0P6_DUNSA|nr:hypothetical protein DUNSADRAFT_16666 [Dunaliella salina]|eukprot:KAF5840433.1 hypothetical protein DUNSADRAFT_16666 [Dunaliella salina]